MSLLDAVDTAIGGMAEVLTPAHEALVGGLRQLAADMDGGRRTAGQWQQFFGAVSQLHALIPEAASDDGEEALVLALSAAVGDKKKSRTRNAGAGGRQSGRGAGNAADAVAAAGRRRRRGTAS